MPSMFPSMYRSERSDAHPGPSGRREAALGIPKALRAGFYVLVVASIVMILAGLILATSGYRGSPTEPAEFQNAVVRNQRVLAMFNMVLGLVVATLASQLRHGAKVSRRWLLGCIFVGVVFNLVAFIFKAAGPGMALVPILLAIGGLLIYRPSVNAFVEQRDLERQ